MEGKQAGPSPVQGFPGSECGGKGLFKGEGREGAVTVTERGGGPLCSNASTGKGHSSRKAQTTTQAPKRSGAQ